MKLQPTHHVLFDDSVSGIAQGWRYAVVTKIGSKWTHFQLFDGTEHTYKVQNRKWNTLKMRDLSKSNQKTDDHENVIEPEIKRKKR